MCVTVRMCGCVCGLIVPASLELKAQLFMHFKDMYVCIPYDQTSTQSHKAMSKAEKETTTVREIEKERERERAQGYYC